MRKLLFVLSFGLALNCHADSGNTSIKSAFFSGMNNIYKNVVSNIHHSLQLASNTLSDSDLPSESAPSHTAQSEMADMQAALSAMSQDDIKKALPIYQKILAKNPENRAARIGLIRCYLLSNNYSVAKQELATYKAKFGEDKDYQIEMIRYLAFDGKYSEAKTRLNQLLANDPTNDILLDLQQYIDERHDGTVATTSAAGSSTATTSAEDEFNAGKYGLAAKLYKQEVAKNPDDKDAQLGQVRSILLDGKNYHQAKTLLDTYKAKNGEDDAYLTELARYYAFMGQSKNSLAIVTPLLEKNPSDTTLLSIKEYAETHHTAPGTYASSSGHATVQITADQYAKRADRVKTASAYERAAQAYSEEDNSPQALAMINKAVDMDPTNAKILMQRAEIANIADDQLTVYNTFSALYATNPDNKKVILGLARASSRLGKTDQSNYLYSIYTSRYPRERSIWIEYAFNESWSGNDRNAVNLLDYYRASFGETDEYWIARSRIVASADRPREVLEIVHRMLPKYPDNYDLNYANVTALYFNNQPIEMFQALARLNRLQPGTEETSGLNSFIWSPYRDNVSLDLYDSFDTDTVKIGRATLGGQYFLNPTTFLLGSVYAERLSASLWSGLNPIEGGHAVKMTGFNVGANHRFNPILALQGTVGAAHVNDGNNALTYQGDAFIRATDTLQADLLIKRAFYDESARSVSLGVKRNLYQAMLNYQPCLQCYIDVTGSYGTFSDNNTMRYVEVAPAANIFATERWNIRMGVDGQWQKFTRHANDGYYDPFNYRYFSFITGIYLKQDDNIGYEFNIGLGTQKDETFTTWAPANDVSARLYYGLYQDWYLTLFAGASTRGRSISNNPSVGQYRVYNFDAQIIRRLS